MSSIDEFREERIKKAEKLKSKGTDPYPQEVKRTHAIGGVKDNFGELFEKREEVFVCGRVMAVREHGSIIFCDIKDNNGEIQILLKEDALETQVFSAMMENLDIGDFVEVGGIPVLTKTEEKSIQADEARIITKSIRPLPDKWYGLEDKEKRFRRRYLDLLFNPEVRERFDKRIEIMKAVRDFFLEKGFNEVETPILQTEYGGAEAEPFKTKLEALDLGLFLRIAPELYLKRLLCGSYEKIFEMGKSFRNEGMDSSHNPEFTTLEAYWAYKNWEDFMRLMEELLVYIQNKVFEGEKIQYRDYEIDFKDGIKRVSLAELLKEKAGVDISNDSVKAITRAADSFGIDTEGLDRAELIDQIYKKKCQDDLIEPTFVTEHPVCLSPLAKRLPGEPEKTARFQLLLGGYEVVNAFSELNDPIDQKERFERQEKRRQKGKEAHPYDEEFIEALEHGMPPAAGLGIGLDRLVMVLTGAPSIREIIFFPTMRPKEH